MATFVSAAAARAVGTTAVFEEGRHDVQVETVRPCQAKGLPKPIVVAAPKDPGSYPVIVFLHGWNMYSSWYQSLLKHVASHGFIAVAPQLYVFSILTVFNMDDKKDIATTKQVTNWLADEQQGLLHVLSNILKLNGVKPDLFRLALAGHSRGGDTAFAVSLGLKGKGDQTSLDLNFSALIGVDPVAGLAEWLQVAPKVLSGSLINPRMPVLVIGTGLGPEGSFLPPSLPCAPVGVNHINFYKECAPPRYHFTAKDYGHLDMLDDDVPLLVDCMCKRNPEHTKELARRTMGGLMVAFLRATLEDKDEDLNTVLQNPGLAPAVLDQVEHDLA